MIQSMFNTLAGKRIAIFGFAFKADTSDTRESPGIEICRELIEEHAQVVIHDPKALANAAKDLHDLPQEQLVFESDPYRAAEGAHAIALLTDWPQFQALDYRRIFQSMVQPAFLFDGRNLLNHADLFEIGFNVYSIGKRPLSHLD